MPDFVRSSEELMIKFVSSRFGPTNQDYHDIASQVKISALREPSHYDKKIMMLMDVLNLAAVVCCAML